MTVHRPVVTSHQAMEAATRTGGDGAETAHGAASRGDAAQPGDQLTYAGGQVRQALIGSRRADRDQAMDEPGNLRREGQRRPAALAPPDQAHLGLAALRPDVPQVLSSRGDGRPRASRHRIRPAVAGPIDRERGDIPGPGGGRPGIKDS